MDPILINCPACQAAFGLKLAREGQRVARVRCSLCDHGWIERFNSTESPEDSPGVVEGALVDLRPERAATALDILPPIAPPARRADSLRGNTSFIAPQTRPPRSRSPLVRGLACSIAGLAAFAFLFAKKDLIVAKVPALAGLYASVGAPVNNRGLQLREVKSVLSEDNGQRILMVEGMIANVKTGQTPIPDMRVSVRTAAGREVYHWVTPAPKPHLAAGEITSFRARLVAAPEEGREIKVQFAEKIEPAVVPPKDSRKKK